MDRLYLILDTETGGLDAGKYPLLEIGIKVYERIDKMSTEFSRFHAMISDSKGAMTMQALKVNGWYDRTPTDSSSVDCTAFNLARWSVDLSKQANDIVIVGHNVNFDVNYVNSFMFKAGYHGWKGLFSYRHLDTATLIRGMQAAGWYPDLESTGLHATAKYFGIDTGDEHTAMSDVNTTWEVLCRLIWDMKPPVDLANDNWKGNELS